jgi:hypothetical protein
MAELASMTAYDDVSLTAFTLEPISDSEWLEVSTTKSFAAKIRASINRLVLKNKMVRRMYKTDIPVMENVGAFGTSEGYVAPPKVAHTISVSTAVFCDEGRVTITDIANALKLHINTLLGDAAAGTANVYRDATAMPRKFVVSGVGGD